MGNLVSCGLGHAPSKHVVKLVHSNGLVEEFYRPVRVGELTVDYPHHFICHSDDLNLMCSGSALPPISLSEDDDMELGQIYFLLPTNVFQSPLTQADIAALLSKAAVARKASYKGLHANMIDPLPPLPPAQPDAEMIKLQEEYTPTTAPQVTLSKEFVHRLLAETRLKLQSTISINPSSAANHSLTPELQTVYTRHILARSCARLWRPPLETIEEGSFTVP